MKDGAPPSDAELTLASISEEEAEQRLFLLGLQVIERERERKRERKRERERHWQTARDTRIHRRNERQTVSNGSSHPET